MPPCLTLSDIRYVSRVKRSNPGKGVVPSPTPRCRSYWIGSLLVALNYDRQLYFSLYLYSSLTTARYPGNIHNLVCHKAMGRESNSLTMVCLPTGLDITGCKAPKHISFKARILNIQPMIFLSKFNPFEGFSNCLLYPSKFLSCFEITYIL